MGHAHNHSAYSRLVNRLNKLPQGAPPSDLLYKILKMLFSEREAELTALLPIRPFTAATAAKRWKMPEIEAEKILDQLAGRAILVDAMQGDRRQYVLPPPMAGFFEFSMMRVRNDIDQPTLSDLLYQYLNVEEDFIRALFTDGRTGLGRIFVHESSLSPDQALHVLDYERAGEVIRTARHVGISICYCRHKMEHLGKDCDAPKEICMTFGNVADSLIRHGHARRIDAAECRALLDTAQAHNLVQFGENVQREVSFICNCCGCCCEALLAIKRFGLVQPITSNFIASIVPDACTRCGRCETVCPVDALKLEKTTAAQPDSASDQTAATDAQEAVGSAPIRRIRSLMTLDASICLGCGVCVRNCPAGAIHMESRPDRVITPVDTVHRTVQMAVERGTLQHLILDNNVMAGYRALAAVLGAILRLPPVKRLLANQQLQSRWLDYMIKRYS